MRSAQHDNLKDVYVESCWPMEITNFYKLTTFSAILVPDLLNSHT